MTISSTISLQFIHKRHGRVWLEHVQTVDIGQKDSHRSLFSVWQEIFQLPRPKRKRFAAYANNENQNSSSCTRDLLSNDLLAQNSRNVGDQRRLSAVENRFHNVLHSAMSSGQYEKVAQGNISLHPRSLFCHLFRLCLHLTHSRNHQSYTLQLLLM